MPVAYTRIQRMEIGKRRKRDRHGRQGLVEIDVVMDIRPIPEGFPTRWRAHAGFQTGFRGGAAFEG